MTGHLTVEVDLGSVFLGDRPASRSFVVRIRRDEHYEIVASSLTRDNADRIADRLAKLLA
jgi:hypothetical protein